jgi:hypothetical protein
VAARETTSARRWNQGATTNPETRGGTETRLIKESLPQQGGGAREPPQARSHVAPREPSSAGRRRLGATTGPEPRGDTGACLSKEAEPGSHHGLEATWWHGSPPQQGGRAREPPQVQSHVAAREPASVERQSHHGLGTMWWHGSLPQQGGGVREPPQARSHVTAREPAST